MAALPDLHVSDSSEAMLSGRKPPFRLLVRAAHRDGRKVNIRHAVSEGFVVSLLLRNCHQAVPAFSSSCNCIVINIWRAVSESFVVRLLLRHRHQIVPALSSSCTCIVVEL